MNKPIDEAAHWKGKRELWYRYIREHDYDWQYAADLLVDANHEMSGQHLDNDPVRAIYYMMELSNIIILTCQWIIAMNAEKASKALLQQEVKDDASG